MATEVNLYPIFDTSSRANPHVAFGHGIHYCVGAPLARMEGSIAFNALFDRSPDIAMATPVDDLEWSENILLHGMKEFPVTW